MKPVDDINLSTRFLVALLPFDVDELPFDDILWLPFLELLELIFLDLVTSNSQCPFLENGQYFNGASLIRCS